LSRSGSQPSGASPRICVPPRWIIRVWRQRSGGRR
jgi:hypothetical protein